MAKDNTIEHSGVIESIGPDGMKVRIRQLSACADCKAASFCNSAESKDKVIDVTGDPADHHVGDEVSVAASLATGYRAVMTGFGIPLIIMVAALVITLAAGGSEPLAALIGVGSLVPYFFIVWLMRAKIKKAFTFRIKS